MNMGTMKSKLTPILSIVNWSALSREYFGRTRAWLYQKMSKTDVNGNGRPFDFSEEERQQLKESLLDIARRITEAAEKI